MYGLWCLHCAESRAFKAYKYAQHADCDIVLPVLSVCPMPI